MSSPPPYTKPEYERRWLVEAEAALESHAGQATIYKLGKKYEPEALGSHHVVSTYLNEAEYKLLASLPARVARKRRFTVSGGALDVYELPNPGLRVFEVEFTSPEEAESYAPPNGIGQEITDVLAFTGHSLAGAA
jgi:CYTH domain-containing protein